MQSSTGRIKEFESRDEAIKEGFDIELSKKQAEFLGEIKPENRVEMHKKMEGLSAKFGKNYFKKDTANA